MPWITRFAARATVVTKLIPGIDKATASTENFTTFLPKLHGGDLDNYWNDDGLFESSTDYFS